MFFTLWMMKNTKEIKKDVYYYVILTLVSILLVGGCKSVAYFSLGLKVDPLTWEAAYHAKNVYLDYNNQNKNLEVSGIYELLFRSAYLYFKERIFFDQGQIREEIDLELDQLDEISTQNKYTGLFKGKNLIYILMESIDSWLVTEEVMPTLTQLEKTGWNFTNRYAPSFGGGQTINSEFAMNTGLYAIENGKAIYNYDQNTYSQSLASLFRKNGYSAISIHTNTGNFYNRTFFHQALGYDMHYALDDIYTINHRDYNYYNDSDLIKSDDTYHDIVREEPFLSFVITYSAHVPYDNTNERCMSNPYQLAIKGNLELSCIRNLARETDEMLKVLLQRLQQDGLLENTVLVLATDHYSYGYSDLEMMRQYKNTTSDYLLQNVPLVIWTPGLEHQEISTLMDTADILPTLFNLFDISYQPKYYVGTDVFSSRHENFVYFSKDIFYDGKTLYDSNMKLVENEVYVNDILKKIREKMNLNNQMIISDYFKGK